MVLIDRYGMSPMSTVMLTALTMNCLMSVVILQDSPGVRLAFSYSFTNNSDRAAYVFNRLYNELESRIPVVDSSIINIVRNADRVVVSKRVLPVPAGLLVEKRNIPCLTRVDPGTTITENLAVRMPARQYSPYPTGPYQNQVTRYPANFELGFFLAYPGREDVIPVIDTNLGRMPCLDAFSDAAQQILRVGPITSDFRLAE
jgi:hypothetical protein